MKNMYYQIISIAVFFAVVLIIVSVIHYNFSSSMNVMMKLDPKLDITVDKLIKCNKSENKCVISEIKLSDINARASVLNSKDPKKIKKAFDDFNNKINTPIDEFSISDVISIDCEMVKERGLQNGNSIVKYNAIMKLKTRNLELDSYPKSSKCDFVAKNTMNSITNLSENEYQYIFGGNINDTPEEKEQKKIREAEMNEMFEKAKKDPKKYNYREMSL